MSDRIARAALGLFLIVLAGVILACGAFGLPEPDDGDSTPPPPQTAAEAGINITIDQIECCLGPGQVAVVSIHNTGEGEVFWTLTPRENTLGVTVSEGSGSIRGNERVNLVVSAGCPEVGVESFKVTVGLSSPGFLRSVTPVELEISLRHCSPRERELIEFAELLGLEGLIDIRDGVPAFDATGERIVVSASSSYGIVDLETGTTQVVSSGGAAHFGAVPLIAPHDSQSDVLVAFGPNGLEIRPFISADGAFSPFAQVDPPSATAVFDVTPYAGADDATGVVVARSDQVTSREYSGDAAVDGLQDGAIEISAAALSSAGATGDVVSAFALSATGPVLVVTDGSPGAVFHWTADDPDNLTTVGNVGGSPRRIRGVKLGDAWILGVSNFADSTLTLVRVDSAGGATITGTETLGGQPVGIDAAQTADGAAAFVATGFDTDTVTVLKVSADGVVLSNTTTNLDPAEVDAPGHAAWLADGSLAISGHESNTVLILPEMLP